MKKISFLPKRIRYVLACVVIASFIFVVFQIPKWRKTIREICLDKNFSWNKGPRLFVTNHPSWLDQAGTIALRLPFWGTEYNPFILVAEDSIKKLPYLKIFEHLAFILPIERRGSNLKKYGIAGKEVEEVQSRARKQMRGMIKILEQGTSLMLAGAPGRDFRGENENGDFIYSPAKGRRMRRFTELCGTLAARPGVETIPVCIDGTQELYPNGKFSPYRFFISFWFLGRIKVTVVYGKGMFLEGNSPAEATEIIQREALNLLDVPDG